MENNFIEALVAAAGRYGVPCVVLAGHAGGNGAAPAEEDDDDVAEVVAPFMTPAAAGVDAAEVDQLRGQVQKLTAALQEAQKAPAANGSATAQVPAGNLGSADGLSVEVLGFEDDALPKKLMRNGYETVGKLRAGFLEGKLAAEGLKLKREWLIEVGMKLAGAGPSGGAPAVTVATGTTAGAAPVSDAPTGHLDRPWLERLAAAKQKQHELDEGRAKLAAKQAEMAKLVKAKKEVPTDLDDQIIAIEEGIMKDEARMVVLRWSMNLDFDSAISLDESLQRANLGPWMSNPQPRLAPK